eukprot:CAMPEP_0183717618 /NCGR_PEP_ID=MMETSP0737-20130205/11191_1 /TAXON_ID=385413 /ORGANISM="Thalassiosira miniscula, Strain CCMP1093" /LENGTH=164 /DNA_ID=CAMNT_0025947091 /DNA_START=155 /DNA_END=646 /DNA_ORIENTATION=-
MVRRREMAILEKKRSEKEKIRRQRIAMKKPIQTPPYGRIILGPDGNLYRVVAPARSKLDDSIYFQSDIKRPENNLSEENQRGNVSSTEESNVSDDEPMDDDTEYSNVRYGCKHADGDWHVNGKGASMKEEREPILVEDVPDEEDEELCELHSVWRNRVPSHGQW